MGIAGKTVMFIGGGIIFFTLLKDNTLPKIFQDAANGAKDFATGLRPVTSVT